MSESRDEFLDVTDSKGTGGGGAKRGVIPEVEVHAEQEVLRSLKGAESVTARTNSRSLPILLR